MRPRRRAGEISEIYNGHTIEAMPTPTPPIQRKKISEVDDQLSAQPIEQINKKNEAASNPFLRPNRSLVVPASRQPSIAPTMAELTNQPSINEERVNLWTIKSLAPDITNRSYPKSSPPSVEAKQQNSK